MSAFYTDAAVAATLCGAAASNGPLATQFTDKPEWFQACTGVIGGRNGAYGAYVDTLDAPARTEAGGFSEAADNGALAAVTLNGCAFVPEARANDVNRAALTPLHITAADFAAGSEADALAALRSKLVALQKVWGASEAWPTGGVLSDNVYSHYDATLGQHVLRLRVVGDDVPSTGGADPNDVGPHVPPLALGVSKNVDTKPQYPLQRVCRVPASVGMPDAENAADAAPGGDAALGAFCPRYEQNGGSWATGYKRTGACIATAAQYGPGKYTVKARVPRTNWRDGDGRGYVFAMWTFGYSEIYQNPGAQPVDAVPQLVHSGDPAALQGLVLGNDDDGRYVVANPEIDIEIPANSPQHTDTVDAWRTRATWATMNCNTWVSDVDKYDNAGGEAKAPYYTQAEVSIRPDAAADAGGRMPPASFISEDGEYHEYTIDWYVHPESGTKPGVAAANNYVKFYFDGHLVFQTRRWVPTRAGRLVIGPWMGWWGSGRQSPAFDTAHVDIAEIHIEPYAATEARVLSMPQTYDQAFGPDQALSCDFVALPVRLRAPSESPASSAHGMPAWAWLLVALAVLGLVAGGIAAVLRVRRSRQPPVQVSDGTR